MTAKIGKSMGANVRFLAAESQSSFGFGGISKPTIPIMEHIEEKPKKQRPFTAKNVPHYLKRHVSSLRRTMQYRRDTFNPRDDSEGYNTTVIQQ